MRNRLSIPYLFLFFVLTCFQTLSAQMQKVDSLENVLRRHASNNREKVDIMNEIGYIIYSKDTPKAMKYASESGRLSDQLNYTKGKAVSLWIKGLAYIKSDKQSSLNYFRQSLVMAEVIKEQTVICNCLIAIGNVYKELGDIPKSDESYERALKIANEINDKNLLLKCLVNVARSHSTKGEYIKAIEILERAILLGEELKDYPVLSKALNNLAWIYGTQGNYTVALECHLKALKINEQLHDKSAMVANYVNIAGIQSDQREYKDALNYLQKALKISEEIKDNFKISSCLANIGHIYMNMNDPRALEYYEKSLKIGRNSQLSLTINILVNMSTIYTRAKDFPKALDHLNEAFHLAEKINLKRAKAEIWVKMGLIYIQEKRYAQALDYTKKGLEIANELKLLNLQKNIYGQLSEIYAATNNYQAAYQNHMLYKLYNDSIFNENNIKKLADLESAYKYDKAKQVYEIEAQNKGLKIKNQQAVILFLIVAFVLLLLLVIMTTRSYRLKKQLLSLELEEINAELEKNQKEMTSATLKLVQTAERDVRSIKMLENIEKNTTPEVKDEIKSLIFDYRSQTYNSNWEEFEILFQKVHPSFYKNLNDHFPMLTQNERKLCVFLKLNMTNKQIAQITFQSEEALKKARQRLRKKFEIERDTNLVSFIQNI